MTHALGEKLGQILLDDVRVHSVTEGGWVTIRGNLVRDAKFTQMPTEYEVNITGLPANVLDEALAATAPEGRDFPLSKALALITSRLEEPRPMHESARQRAAIIARELSEAGLLAGWPNVH